MIYLDHNATTPILPAVFEAMCPYLKDDWGNPSSSYRFGAKLKAAIADAREKVAALVGASPSEILFTSCATESNNSAINAALKANPTKRHVLTTAVEHSSVLSHCKALEREDYRVTYLPVDREGLIKLSDLAAAITNETAVVSIMWANNETGVLSPIKEISELCASRNVLFHCDAVQAVGKIPINMKTTRIDYLSLSGHKIHGPKGVGTLFVRKKAPFTPFLHGGHQERGYRGGTENVASLVGLGKAAEIALEGLSAYTEKVKLLRDRLENTILSTVPQSELNGSKTLRLPNTANFTFHGVEAEALLLLLDTKNICASSGSACLADSDEPSHVVKAMKPEIGSRNVIRFSLSTLSTSDEIDQVAPILKGLVQRLQS